MSIRITLKQLQEGLQKANPGKKVIIKKFTHAPAVGGRVIEGKELENLLKD